jgi:hypothetical protein
MDPSAHFGPLCPAVPLGCDRRRSFVLVFHCRIWRRYELARLPSLTRIARRSPRSSRRPSIEPPLAPIMSSSCLECNRFLQGSDPSSVDNPESTCVSHSPQTPGRDRVETWHVLCRSLLCNRTALVDPFRESEEFVLLHAFHGRFALHKEAQTGTELVSVAKRRRFSANPRRSSFPVFKKKGPAWRDGTSRPGPQAYLECGFTYHSWVACSHVTSSAA